MSEWVSLCKICNNRSELEKSYQQGEAHMIDEMTKKINSRKSYFEEYYPDDSVAIAEANVYLEILKQMKEQKNDN